MAYQSPVLDKPSTSGTPGTPGAPRRPTLEVISTPGARNGSKVELRKRMKPPSPSMPSTKAEPTGCQLQPSVPPPMKLPSPELVPKECGAATVTGVVTPPEKAPNRPLPRSVKVVSSCCQAPPTKPPR